MGQIIAFVSGKGGTGKTSVCAGVASALALSGKTVLCIDGDVGLRNLDLSLGIPDLAFLPFTELIRGTCELDSIPEHPELPGLYLLTAPVTETPETISPLLFRKFTERIRREYDFCLIDAPAGIGAMFQMATDAADRVIVISNNDPASMRDASSVAYLLRNREPDATMLVINRVQPRTVTRMGITLDDVMDIAGLPLLGIVPEDLSVPLAATFRTSLLQYTDKKAARACRNIAARLSGRHIPLMKF